MNLWLLTAALFFAGLVLAGLRERSLRTQSVARPVAEAAVAYLTYVIVAGLLVAFNLFQLDRIDPFFTNTPWHIFGILYWPSWVLTFAPLMLAGSLVVVAFGMRRPQRIVALALLLVASCAALEIVFLLNVGVLSTALVQLFLFVLFAGGVYKASRAGQPNGSET